MNTRKYLRLFKYSLDAGDIPQELYDRVVAEVEVDGKMTWRVYGLYLEELERRRLFTADGAPFDTKNSAQTDGRYVYLHPKNPFWHIGHAITSTIYKFVGWLGSGLVYGMWHFPRKYAKKFKGVGACITVSNHVGYIDACLTRRALGCRKQYTIAAPHNCKRNFGGMLLRSATVIPLPSSFKGTKPFNEALRYYAARGASFHFYAEKAMWLRYRKPRPYMDGAFFYADWLGVPVVPMLYCFYDPKGLRKLLGLPRATVRVADPVYADPALPPQKRRADMAARTAAAVNALYEEFYGIPMQYLPPAGESDKNTGQEKQDEDHGENNCNS